jgi:hypothetical protein
MTIRYRINGAPGDAGGQSITCLVCQRTSHNPTDVEMLYCGYCHQFLRDPGDDDSVYNSADKVADAVKRTLDEDGLI